MANWDRAYNAPAAGAYHFVYVEKPANFVFQSITGNGTSATPWKLYYVNGASAANLKHPTQLSRCLAGSPWREAYLEVYLNGVRQGGTDRPPVRDGVGGGSETVKGSSRAKRKSATKKKSSAKGSKRKTK